MLSDRGKVQIGYMTHSRQPRSDHLHTIQVIIELIQDGESMGCADVRTVCTDLGWSRKSTDELCDMVDDVGLTLFATGAIDRW